MTRSPVSATCFVHGHFHFFRLQGGVLGAGRTPGNDALPWNVPSDQLRGCPPSDVDEFPAWAAALFASGNPLSCDRIGLMMSSSSSKKGSICTRLLAAGLALYTSRANDSSDSMAVVVCREAAVVC